MPKSINILMAQINPTVGDVDANCNKILHIIDDNKHQNDLIVFPELALSGYQLEDLLFRRELFSQIDVALQKICNAADNNCHVIVGHPVKKDNKTYNQASTFANSTCINTYTKQKLPNYGIFDEQRYYNSSSNILPALTINGYKIKLCICEDLWEGEVKELIGPDSTDVLISINGSPFEYGKHAKRIKLCQKYAKHGISILYINQVGGQDELVFDGASFAMDKTGRIAAQMSEFEESQQSININAQGITGKCLPLLKKQAAIYQAIVLGLKDYLEKSNFKKVLLGLSGGIDSALCLAIAVDAIGAENVEAILLPSQYTATISNEDAIAMATNLGVKYTQIPISDSFSALLNAIAPITDSPKDLTKQNLQARIRGTLLMAISNDRNAILICTSNKSEAAVGYSTLYGDMNGGFAPIKDLYKTQVYELANFCNREQEIIPKRIIDRAPSAELAPEQKDEDNLPKYSILDPILEYYIEQSLTIDEIVARGFTTETVEEVIRLISNSEYKRRQAVLGPKISKRAFGKDWRLPLAKKFTCKKKLTR